MNDQPATQSPIGPTQPSFVWLRTFAIFAMLNLCGLAWFKPEVPEVFIWVLVIIILMWGLGSNAREAVIDVLKARANR